MKPREGWGLKPREGVGRVCSTSCSTHAVGSLNPGVHAAASATPPPPTPASIPPEYCLLPQPPPPRPPPPSSTPRLASPWRLLAAGLIRAAAAT